jgi:hypothetical protein
MELLSCYLQKSAEGYRSGKKHFWPNLVNADSEKTGISKHNDLLGTNSKKVCENQGPGITTTLKSKVLIEDELKFPK